MRRQWVAFGSSEDADALIERLKRLFGRSDPNEDLISAYIDSTDEAEPGRIEEMLRASGVDVENARSVRETSRLLRSLDTVQAPRSYALTPDTLAEHGYSDREIEEILDARSRRGGLRLRNAAVYVPLAIAAVALTGVALITIGDLTDYVTDRFDGESEAAAGALDSLTVAGEMVVQTVVVEKQVVVETERMAMEAPAAVEATGVPAKSTETAVPSPSPTPELKRVIQTVLVEKAVVVTVVVEKEVQVAAETVMQPVEVVKVVEKIVEKEVPVTVVVEKVVEVEKEVEVIKEVEVERVVEVVVEKEVMVEAMAVPTATPAVMAKTAAASESPEAAEDSADPPKEAPCAIIPTPVSKPSASPETATTPEPTPTMLPIPTCTPTPTPTPTATETSTPTPTP